MLLSIIWKIRLHPFSSNIVLPLAHPSLSTRVGIRDEAIPFVVLPSAIKLLSCLCKSHQPLALFLSVFEVAVVFLPVLWLQQAFPVELIILHESLICCSIFQNVFSIPIHLIVLPFSLILFTIGPNLSSLSILLSCIPISDVNRFIRVQDLALSWLLTVFELAYVLCFIVPYLSSFAFLVLLFWAVLEDVALSSSVVLVVSRGYMWSYFIGSCLVLNSLTRILNRVRSFQLANLFDSWCNCIYISCVVIQHTCC